MTNYPPGVSGNEPEIAGHPEYRNTVRCANSEARFVPAHLVNQITHHFQQQVLYGINGNPGYGTNAMSTLLVALSEATRELDCEFQGVVDVTLVDVTEVWECPDCGYSNEQEIDFEDMREQQREAQAEIDRDER